MSVDSVDDIHAAEDFAGSLAQAINEIAAAWEGGDLATAVRNAVAIADGWNEYCRPTCRAEGDPDLTDECSEQDLCGCPCGHSEAGPD